MKTSPAEIMRKALIEKTLQRKFAGKFSIDIAGFFVVRNRLKNSITFTLKNSLIFTDEICEIIGCENGKKSITKTAEEWVTILNEKSANVVAQDNTPKVLNVP